MSIEMNKLLFVEPTSAHNNFGLQMWGDYDLIDQFYVLSEREFGCRAGLTSAQYDEQKAFRCFWQGRTSYWLHLEFWIEKTPENRLKIETVARKMADELKVPFFGTPVKAMAFFDSSVNKWFAELSDGRHIFMGGWPHPDLYMGMDENRHIFVDRDGNFIGFV